MKACPDCGVQPNSPHQEGCDVERCTVCKGQRLSCDCEGHNSKRSVWTGEWPGVVECRDLGWYCCVPLGETGRRPCDASHPGAIEDLNRWSVYMRTGKDPMTQ